MHRPAEASGKRIVLACDGTWNTPDQRDRIPNLPANLMLCAGVAYHHGSSTDWCVATESTLANAVGAPRIAYSYGTHAHGRPNHYGHPNRTNYQKCHPDWDAKAQTTEDARFNNQASVDLDW